MSKSPMQCNLFLWVALVALVGCATPRYETVITREAPAGASAQACLQGCETQLSACKQTCADNYQACLKRVEPMADEHYRRTLDHYAADLAQYRHDISTYELHLWMNWNWHRGSFWYDPWPYPSYYPHYALPPPPGPPSREADMNRFREEKCGGDCGCQPPYDACFQGCGGKIISERRCVSNCP
jgi:hypothetical protein